MAAAGLAAAAVRTIRSIRPDADSNGHPRRERAVDLVTTDGRRRRRANDRWRQSFGVHRIAATHGVCTVTGAVERVRRRSAVIE